MTNSSPEAIQQAKVLLGLIKADDTDLIKAKKEAEEKESKEKEAKEKNEKLAKAKEEYDEHMKKASEFMSKAEAIKSAHADEAKMWGSTEGDSDSKMPKQGTVSMKAEDIELIKADITKGFNEKIDATVLLYQEKEKENTELKKANDDLKKSFEDITGKLTSFEELLQKIGKSSAGPKSLIKATQVVDRFAPVKDGERELSISRNKEQVKAELIKAAGNDFGPTNIFAKAASCIEYAGALGVDAHDATEVAQALRKLNGTIIVG